MAQVRKLNNGEKVPTPKKGNINYNGTTSEFSDEIYNELINTLDTSAASGIIRKGFDLGRKEGHTFNYDSEYNRAYVTNAQGEKIWDYQATIGPRSNFKVRWQGTFGRGNLAKNPNDVNRLLQAVMQNFNPAPESDDPKPPTKENISSDNIVIKTGDDKKVSVYDKDYTSALNRLALLSRYYTEPEAFVNTYNFSDNDSRKIYLDTHKNRIYKVSENGSGQTIFNQIMEKVASGTFDKDEEELLNALGIYVESPKKPETKSKPADQKPGTIVGSEILDNNGANPENLSNSGVNQTSNQNPENLQTYSFNNYYLPQYYDATVTKSSGLPEHLWTGAKSWSNGDGNYLELTNTNGDKYYVYSTPSNLYLRSAQDPNNIFLDEETFWDLIEKNNFTPDPTDNWETLQWMPRTELVRTQEGGPISTIGWEVLNIANENIPIRKDLSENPNYYAKLKNGSWIKLTNDEYNKLKTGDLKVLNNKKPVTFYKEGGILKMQNTPGGTIPVYNLPGTYEAEPYQNPNSNKISGWDKAAVIGTGVGTTGAVVKAVTRHPVARRIANIASLLGYTTAATGNTVSSIKNDNFSLGDLLWTVYGIGRGVTPRPRQYYQRTRVKGLDNMKRPTRVKHGLSLGVGGVGQGLDISTGLLGTTFGTIGTTNFIRSLVNDPDKTMNWNTWTVGDAHNFQMGLTGLTPMISGISDISHDAQLRKRLPKSTNKFRSWKESNTAGSVSSQMKLKRGAVDYIQNNPVKEAFFGNPYLKAINTAKWNNPSIKPQFFTTNPTSFGLTGGLSPYEINPYETQVIVEPVKQSVEPVKINGGVLFKRGGKILKGRDGLGKWVKSLKLNGSFLPLSLEATKMFQSIGTTKKNTQIEKDANNAAARAQYLPPSEKIQLGYDFSAETKGLNTTIGQLNSQFKNLGAATSDNNQMLSGFGMYSNNLSKLYDNYNQQIGAKTNNIDNLNISLEKEFNQSERERLKHNNAVTANNILANAQSEIQQGTNISKDINTEINTLQNWMYKDKISNSGLEYLYLQKQNLLQQQKTGIDVSAQLLEIEKQISEALAKLQMLPSFTRV